MSPARLPAVLALGLTLAVVAPALGDSPDPLKIARKALKTADKALALAKAPVDTDRLASGAVTSIKIANGAVGSVKITPGAVHTSKLANSAVHTSKLARGAVTRVKLRDGSVGRAKIARNAIGAGKVIDHSLTLKDLRGSSNTGALSIDPVPAHDCVSLEVDAPGAQPGQLPLVGFTGDVPVPGGLIFDALRVSAPGKVTVRACNVADNASAPVAGLSTRIVTLG